MFDFYMGATNKEVLITKTCYYLQFYNNWLNWLILTLPIGNSKTRIQIDNILIDVTP